MLRFSNFSIALAFLSLACSGGAETAQNVDSGLASSGGRNSNSLGTGGGMQTQASGGQGSTGNPTAGGSSASAGAAGAGMTAVQVDPQAPDEIAFQEALSIYRSAAYADAVLKWESFLSEFPDSIRADNAQYLLGESHYELKDYPSAQVELNALLQEFPNSSFKDNAEYYIGRCEFLGGNYQQALTWFQTSLSTDPTGTYADNDQYYIGRCHYELGDKVTAIADFEALQTNYPQTSYLDNASYYMGRSYFSEKDYPSARDAFQKTLTFVGSPYLDNAEYYSGRSEYAMGNLETALTSTTPTTAWWSSISTNPTASAQTLSSRTCRTSSRVARTPLTLSPRHRLAVAENMSTLVFAKRLGRSAALGLASAICWTQPADAQDMAEDHGSRATREEVELDSSYKLGLFSGAYAQDDQPGGLIAIEVQQKFETSRHETSLEGSYSYDSFSTKTFNFPEEDQVTVPVANRIVQPAHQGTVQLQHESAWSKTVSTELKATGDILLPELELDHRGIASAAGKLRLGRKHGTYGEARTKYSFKKYPNYRLSDRSIDQQEGQAQAELGYDMDDVGELAGGCSFEYTDYLDARYDRELPDGSVTRATESKDYLSLEPYVTALFRPNGKLRVRLTGKLQVNDSQNYNRNVLGLAPDGGFERHYIENYYDYLRPRVELSIRIKPSKKLLLRAMSEVWTRRFATYEARDVNNFWTGELRRDVNLEVGLEASYRLAKLGNGKHELHSIAFGSHLHRQSNMKREVSLATNFDVTRVFIGFELSSS
jgi:TolA-binding protein